MAKSFDIITPSTVALFTTAEAKAHLKVDSTADDTLIDNLIEAARESAEVFTNRFFINTLISQHGDTFADLEYLFKSPVNVDDTAAIIRYYDSDNATQTLDTSVYLVDQVSQPGRVTLDVDQSFPTIANRTNAVSCRYTVGYGAAASDVPQGIKQAVLLTIGNWYENRQDVVVGRIATELPKSAQYLLEQYKVQTV